MSPHSAHLKSNFSELNRTFPQKVSENVEDSGDGSLGCGATGGLLTRPIRDGLFVVGFDEVLGFLDPSKF